MQGRKQHEYADPPHALGLLRPRVERPTGGNTANERDELPPPCMSGEQDIEG